MNRQRLVAAGVAAGAHRRRRRRGRRVHRRARGATAGGGRADAAAEPPRRRELPARRPAAAPGAPRRRLLRRAAGPTSSARWHRLAGRGGAPAQREAAPLRARGAPGAARARADRGDRQRRPGRRRHVPHAPARRRDPAATSGRRGGTRCCWCSTSSPGRSDFFTETTRLERWLREPDVGLALDPEWRVSRGRGARSGDRPRRRARGQRDVRLARAARRRATTCRRSCFIVHQFTDDMVDDSALQAARAPRDGAQRGRLRHAAGQDLQVPRVHPRRPRSLRPGLQAVLRGGRRADEARPRCCACTPPPDVVVYE